MIIQTTTRFNNSLDAQDSLAGLRRLPGFCVGYVTQKSDNEFETVTLIKCQHGEPQRGQKLVLEAHSRGFTDPHADLSSHEITEAVDSIPRRTVY